MPPTTSKPCFGSTNSMRPKHSRSRIFLTRGVGAIDSRGLDRRRARREQLRDLVVIESGSQRS
jgi:hypothetical protein